MKVINAFSGATYDEFHPKQAEKIEKHHIRLNHLAAEQVYIGKTAERPEAFEKRYGIDQQIYSTLNHQAQRNVIKQLDLEKRNKGGFSQRERLRVNPFNTSKISQFSDTMQTSVGAEPSGAFNPQHVASQEAVPYKN